MKFSKRNIRNLVSISNIDDFFECYTYTEYHATHLEILAELEKKVMFLEDLPIYVTVDYKDDGVCVFRLENISTCCVPAILYYAYELIAS